MCGITTNFIPGTKKKIRDRSDKSEKVAYPVSSDVRFSGIYSVLLAGRMGRKWKE